MRRLLLLSSALLLGLLADSCTMPDGGGADRPSSQSGWPVIIPVEDSHPMLQDDRSSSEILQPVKHR